MRKNYITIHHSWTDVGDWDFIRNLYTDIDKKEDYNYLILNGFRNESQKGNRIASDDGKVITCIENGPSNHTKYKDFNESSISICLVGNFFSYGPTKPQIESLKKLLIQLSIDNSIPVNKIIGHYEVDPLHMKIRSEACPGPGFDLKELRRFLRCRIHIL